MERIPGVLFAAGFVVCSGPSEILPELRFRKSPARRSAAFSPRLSSRRRRLFVLPRKGLDLFEDVKTLGATSFDDPVNITDSHAHSCPQSTDRYQTRADTHPPGLRDQFGP